LETGKLNFGFLKKQGISCSAERLLTSPEELSFIKVSVEDFVRFERLTAVAEHHCILNLFEDNTSGGKRPILDPLRIKAFLHENSRKNNFPHKPIL
jgi:hypothetical protein